MVDLCTIYTTVQKFGITKKFLILKNVEVSLTLNFEICTFFGKRKLYHTIISRKKLIFKLLLTLSSSRNPQAAKRHLFATPWILAVKFSFDWSKMSPRCCTTHVFTLDSSLIERALFMLLEVKMVPRNSSRIEISWQYYSITQ